MSNVLNKFILINIYIIIIILIPLFVDYLFKITVRRKRNDEMINTASNMATNVKKPLVVFNGRYNGLVNNEPWKTSFNESDKFPGDIIDIIPEMADNSCVIVVSESLEYVDDIPELLQQLKRVSGNKLYIVCVEKNSPRAFWDYQIKHVMENTHYLPNDNKIKWDKPNDLQLKIQYLYAQIFKIIPYNLVSDQIK